MNNINDNGSEKGDRYWKVEEVRSYIIEYFKKIFPDSIIMREFDRIDIMVFGPNIPVEIQRSRNSASHFENEIRKQIEQNIEIFGQCWFFFDTEFLNYLSNIAGNTSINMDWLYQFYKSGKAKVFTIAINGIIKEMRNEDFSFITRFSQTCKVSKEEERRILQRNRSNITFKVLKKHGFTTDEINGLYNEYERNNESLSFINWLRKREGRQNKLANILSSITLEKLIGINEMLKCCMKDRHAIVHSSIIGIIEGNGHHKYRKIRCSDNGNILELFPGYFVKQELWDYWRIHIVDQTIFTKTVKGEYPNYLEDRKRQKNIEDSWE